MAGLLQQGMQPEPQGAPRGAPPQAGQSQPQQAPPAQGQGQPGQGGGDPRVDMDPETGAAQREQLVSAMLESLYGPTLQQARKILQQHQDEPVKGIARVIAQLVTVTWTQLTDQGKTAPPGVIVQAAIVVAQAVGEMAIRLKLLPEDEAETIEAAFMLAMGEFGKATAEKMPPEQRQRYAQLLGAIRDGKQMAQGQGGGQRPPQGQQPRQPQGRPPQGAPSEPPRQGGM